MSKNRGFTFVELLVSIFVIVTVGSVMAQVFFSALRGANKSSSVTAVRQNGDYAISQITNLIQNAKSFEWVYDGTDRNGTCVQPAADPDTRYRTVRLTQFDKTTTDIMCGSPPGTLLAVATDGDTVRLTDSNTVSVTYCYFTCIQKSIVDPPILTIYFELTAKNTTGGATDRSSVIPFQTSVIPRNYFK